MRNRTRQLLSVHLIYVVPVQLLSLAWYFISIVVLSKFETFYLTHNINFHIKQAENWLSCSQDK